MNESERPRIVLTVTDPARHAGPLTSSMRKNRLYAEAVERHGGAPPPRRTSSADERAAAFAAMDGLLLTGGADIDPARYGRPNLGSLDIEPERDALEAAAWAAAEARGVPVFGICRGFQAINVFAGGTLHPGRRRPRGSRLEQGPGERCTRSGSTGTLGWPVAGRDRTAPRM